MAMDLSEAEDMLEASERNPGLVAQLVPAPFDFRLGPTIRRLIDEGALGDIREVTVNVLNASALDPSIPLHWRQRADYSGKNVMMFGIFIEVMHRWLGDHSDVMASGDIFISERTDAETGALLPVTVPDTYVVTGHLKRGARITYHFSSVAAGADSNGVTVFGTKATLRWKMGDTAVHPASWWRGKGTRTRPRDRPGLESRRGLRCLGAGGRASAADQLRRRCPVHARYRRRAHELRDRTSRNDLRGNKYACRAIRTERPDSQP